MIAETHSFLSTAGNNAKQNTTVPFNTADSGHSGLDSDSLSDSPRLQIYLLPKTGRLQTLTLPGKISGSYRLTLPLDNHQEITVDIEAAHEKWIAKCKSPAHFRGENGSFSSTVLIGQCCFTVEHPSMSGCLYAEAITDQQMQFHRYRLVGTDIHIGRQSDIVANDLACRNRYVSRNHALLHFDGQDWSIADKNSTNGVYVNDEHISKLTLHPGDHIFMMGVRIIMGVGFIAVNDGNNGVQANAEKLVRVSETSLLHLPSPVTAVKETAPFNRLPRIRKPMNVTPITLEGPPVSISSGNMPMVLRMGSSAIMAGSAALRGNFTSILTSLLFPILSQKYSDNEKKQYEALRQTKYQAYLMNRRAAIAAEKAAEENVLRNNYPPLPEVLTYLQSKNQLWERRPKDDDFLSLRIGSGRIPLLAEIEYPQEKFDLETDELETQMKTLAQTPVYLENIPIMADMRTHRVCSVTGAAPLRFELAKRLLLQLCLLHSYDEVKTVFLMEPEDLAAFDVIRYLPHAWSDRRDFRFIATTASEAGEVGEKLSKELTLPQNGNPAELRKKPNYVLFAFSKRLFDCIEVIKDTIQNEQNTLLSVFTFFDEAIKESTLMISLSQRDGNTIRYLTELDRPPDRFHMDALPTNAFSDSIYQMANIHLKRAEEEIELPKTFTFLEMYGVGRVEQLNPLKRWRESNPMKTLSAPVGIGTDGELFHLDLHQKYQGPHGLVAGMTGSGKSEFLITYILSMALNYSPEEVSFLLIDYKGGGLAGAFDDPDKGLHLPHLVGTITNLDGSAVQRSMVCINAELIRRQRVFNEAKSLSDEGTMDIYQYQKLYRQGIVSQPVPHLFIISDEFAELKDQEPDFMDTLISAARIGRSLGVHLILATQKPSGVVNDQIRSNTKFRVCLKVQDRADSQDMLLRPDAAELKDTGRFYLQIGYNEYFALGQSAWAGATYEPQDSVVSKKDDELVFLDNVGQSLLTRKPTKQNHTAQGSQLVAVVRLLSDLAQKMKIVPQSLWEPALPAQLPIRDKLLVPGSLRVPIGLLDDIEHQCQTPMYLDFASIQNLMICGLGGSGKSSLIQTILLSLCRQCSPEEVNFYILDYSSRTFKSFDSLPHCGAVLYEEDSEYLKDFFSLIKDIISERKKLFAKLEVDSFEAARTLHPLPLLLIIIDNIAAMSNNKVAENLMRDIHLYMRDAARYGVKYIVACNKQSELNSQARLTVNAAVALHMKDTFDYSDLTGCKVSHAPADVPGRGVVSVDGRPLEMQTFLYQPEEEAHARLLHLKEELKAIAENRTTDLTARRLPIVDEKMEYSDFMRQFSDSRIPLGFSISSKKAVSLPLKQFCTLSLYFGNPDGVVPVTGNFLSAIQREKMELWVMKRAKGSLFETASALDADLWAGAKTFSCTPEGVTAFQNTLYSQFLERMPVFTQYCKAHSLDTKQADIRHETFDYMMSQTAPLLVWVESMADLAECASEANRLALDPLFLKGRKLNIYYIAAFEPDDYRRAFGCSFYGSFSEGETVLLMGGRLMHQQVCTIVDDFGAAHTQLPHNQAFVRYRQSIHRMLIPCGEIKAPEVDPDEASIF